MSYSYSDDQIISAAMEAGFMLSTGHGQSSTKAMPVSDTATLRNFAKALRRFDGPKTPPQRYTLDSFNDGDQRVRQITTDNQRGEWVKWEDVSSLFATNEKTS